MGGIANAFGRDALVRSEVGELGLVIDGLDEAQLRAGPEGFSAGLRDLANLIQPNSSLPTVLLGRSLAAEEAWYVLEEAGQSCCIMDIQYFNNALALAYLKMRLPLIAAERSEVAVAYSAHPDRYYDLAVSVRKKLEGVESNDGARFTGYAPVLDAICSYTLSPENTNPQRQLAALSGSNQVELVKAIADGILAREQEKLLSQLRKDTPSEHLGAVEGLYSPDEQREHLGSRLFGYAAPTTSALPTAELTQKYSNMVDAFFPNHPFLDAAGKPANAVFAGDLTVWSLRQASKSADTRKATLLHPGYLSGIILDLYGDAFQNSGDIQFPIEDVSLLHESLKQQVGAGEKASLELVGSDGESQGVVIFEVLSHDVTSQARRTYGPFPVSFTGILELGSPLTELQIDAPIWLTLGQSGALQLEAPVNVNVTTLTIAAESVFVTSAQGGSGDVVSLVAVEADCARTQQVAATSDSLSVFWPNARVYPWTNYAAPEPRAANENVEFLRRRLRRILTSFRSERNSKDLVCSAAKIDAMRMIKDERGSRLVECLVEDGILVRFESEGQYKLNAERVAERFDMDYHALQQSKFSDKSYEYMDAVANRL